MQRLSDHVHLEGDPKSETELAGASDCLLRERLHFYTEQGVRSDVGDGQKLSRVLIDAYVDRAEHRKRAASTGVILIRHEDRVIQEVVCVRAQHGGHVFTETETLMHAEIQAPRSRSFEEIARRGGRIAKEICAD